MLTNNIPSNWMKMLSACRETFPDNNFCIAGGAIRDHYMDMEANDFDIFCDIESELALCWKIEDLRFAFGKNGIGFIVGPYIFEPDLHAKQYESLGPKGYDISVNEDGIPHIAGILEGITTVGKVQIIAKPMKDWSPEKIVETFDYSRIQCWWFDGALHETDACRGDRLKDTFTNFDPEKKDNLRIKAWLERVRREKLKAKFNKDATVLNPWAGTSTDIWTTIYNAKPAIF